MGGSWWFHPAPLLLAHTNQHKKRTTMEAAMASLQVRSRARSATGGAGGGRPRWHPIAASMRGRARHRRLLLP